MNISNKLINNNVHANQCIFRKTLKTRFCFSEKQKCTYLTFKHSYAAHWIPGHLLYLHLRFSIFSTVQGLYTYTYQLASPASNFSVSIPDVASKLRRPFDHHAAASGFVKSM